MPNFRLIGAAVKPAIRHEQTNRQTDANFIYIDGAGLRVTVRLSTHLAHFADIYSIYRLLIAYRFIIYTLPVIIRKQTKRKWQF